MDSKTILLCLPVLLIVLVRGNKARQFECGAYDFDENIDEFQGLQDPEARNLTFKYVRYKNSSLQLQIHWDLPRECAENRNQICSGFYIKWVIFRGQALDIYCYRINGLDKRSYILDKTHGFDGIKRFSVTVVGFPFAKPLEQSLYYIKPPPPEKFVILKRTPVPTMKLTEEVKQLKDKATIKKVASGTSFPGLRVSTVLRRTHAPMKLTAMYIMKQSTVTVTYSQQKNTTITILVTLLSLLVIFIFVILARCAYKKHWKGKYEFPVFRQDCKNVIKGAHYISYLPQDNIMSHVRDICSWLLSHGINIIMDRMFDAKLYNALGPKRFGERFVTKAQKVIMVVTPGYLELCCLDYTMEMNLKSVLNTLDKERLYSEVIHIKNECNTINGLAASGRFLAVLVNVKENNLPKWLNKLDKISWPKDGQTDRFLKILKVCQCDKMFPHECYV